MYIWFLICVFGTIVVIPLHFLSVEHLKLQELYGREKGTKVGEIYGLISGWGLFVFWMGIWISPQPRFSIPFLQNLSVLVPIVNFSIPLFHLILFIFFLMLGVWLAIKGLIEITLRVAETHRTEKIIAKGVYSVVRHPQYLGGLLSHVGISFLFSSWYSLLLTPLMVIVIYLISKKEEEELIKEFGIEYKEYTKQVPMLIPKLSRK